MTTAENIKKARKKAGLTQAKLAEKLNTTQQNLAQYESGKRKPKRETLIKIAKALEISEQELLDYSNASYRMYVAHQDIEPDEDGFVVGDIFVSQKNLLHQYNKLNTAGKAQAIKRIKELQYVPEYTCEDDCPFD